MNSIMVFLHVLGSGGVGFYLFLPFLVGRASRLAGTGQQGLAEGLLTGNRVAQYFLILQLLTGGYLISQVKYTVWWMVLVIVLFLAIAALGGIQAKPLKRIISQLQAGQSASANIAKVRIFSIILLILYVVILYFMTNPSLQG